MPEARRRELDEMLRGLAPRRQRQLSISTSNALDMFSVIESVIQYRKLVLLLDYDGTLTPIVKDPSKALLSERVRAILRELPKHFVTGVISGRSLGKIRAFVDVPGLFYAGSHGFDILAPSWWCAGDSRATQPSSNSPGSSNPEAAMDASHSFSGETKATNGVVDSVANGGGDRGREGGDGGGPRDDGCCSTVLEEVRHQVAAEYLPVMAVIREQLLEELSGIEKAEVEDNRFSISIHYRNCAREDVPRVKEVTMGVQSRHERIRMGAGKEVFELQPDIAWDKGKAVLWLLDKLVMPMTRGQSTGRVHGHAAAAASDATATADGDIVVEGFPSEKAVGEEGLEGKEEEEEEEEKESDFFTIFIGDDRTDENAFRALNGDIDSNEITHEGLGILVSEASRETNAAYTLRNPDEVATFLERIAKLGSERSCGSWR